MLEHMSTRPSLTSRSRRPAMLALTAAIAGSLVLAGCGGSDKKADDGTGPQTTEDGQVIPAVQPLTGLPIEGTLPNHPVIFVKIDNSPASDPQIGVGSADVVFEQLVEGGITRLAVGYYSKQPGVVGPVRSARATDMGIVLPTNGALLASGAAPATIGRLKKAGVNYQSYDKGATGVYRDNSDPLHDSLHSVFVNLPKFSRSLGAAQPPPAYFPWGTEEQFVGTQSAKNIAVQFSSGYITKFKWNGSKFLYTNSFMKSGDEFKPDTVLVLRVKTGDAGYRDLGGNRVPESLFFGDGAAVLFHNGQAIRGTWSKPDRGSALQLSTTAGPLTVPPGKVFVALLPVAEGDPKLTFK